MRVLLILVLSLLGCSGSIDEPVSYFNVETPRPFGYVNGDEIPRRIVLETRSGISLQAGSLPAKGQINRWLNLHQFFLGLGSPYQAYEAESPDALKQAIADIKQLENLPMRYFERIPKQDLSAACYTVASLLLLILLGVKFCEVKR